MFLGGIRKKSPKGIVEPVPMVISEVISEEVTEFNLSYEGMGVSILEGILENKYLGK